MIFVCCSFFFFLVLSEPLFFLNSSSFPARPFPPTNRMGNLCSRMEVAADDLYSRVRSLFDWAGSRREERRVSQRGALGCGNKAKLSLVPLSFLMPLSLSLHLLLSIYMIHRTAMEARRR